MIAQASTVLGTGTSYYLAQQLASVALRRRIGNDRDALLAASKLVGALHALAVGGSALKVILDPNWRHHDLIQTPSSSGDGVVAAEIGYLISGMLVYSLP
jgi:hypothetical protein